MAVHLPLYPIFNNTSLGENEAYLQLIEDYLLDKRVRWSVKELVDTYGEVSLRELLVNKVLLFQTKDYLTLAFLIPGTISNLIKDLVQFEPYSFTEILVSLPKHIKLSSQELKNTASFLYNFGIIQSFTTTATALTFIVSDGPDHKETHPVEKALDKIYHFADRIEPHLAYQMTGEDTAIEFSKLK